MAAPSLPSRLAFVRRHTRLQDVPDVPGLRLHLGDDVTAIWHRTGEFLGLADPPLPYWAFAWSGGLGIARYLLDHPDEVAGRSVVDVGTGSGLCAIVAARLDAASVQAGDIDPFAAAAVELNARANRVRVGFRGRDLVDGPPPPCDVLLAGDVSYEGPMAERMTAWLRRAAADGTRVLIGDPGRAYLPDGLECVATYRARTSREIEEAELTEVTVYTISSSNVTRSAPCGSTRSAIDPAERRPR
jgi:predicted nicotinamide N-methyase